MQSRLAFRAAFFWRIEDVSDKGKRFSQESDSSLLESRNFLPYTTLLTIVTNCLVWICHMEDQECSGCFSCNKSSSLGVSHSDNQDTFKGISGC